MSDDRERLRRLQDRIDAMRRETADELAAEHAQETTRQAEQKREAQSPVRSGRRGPLAAATFYLGLAVVAFVLLQSAMTIAQFTGPDITDATRTGRAVVQSCRGHGPVGNGFGYWDECTAEVVWEDGTTETVRPDKRGFFAAEEIGTTVTIGDLGYGRSGRSLARAELPERPLVVLAAAVLLLPAALIGLVLIWSTWQAVRALGRRSSGRDR